MPRLSAAAIILAAALIAIGCGSSSSESKPADAPAPGPQTPPGVTPAPKGSPNTPAPKKSYTID